MKTFFDSARKDDSKKQEETKAVQPDEIKKAFEPLKSALEETVSVIHADPKKGAGQQIKEAVEGTQSEPTSKHSLG